MTDDLKVRLAGRDEEEALMVMCRELHAENGLFHLTEDMVRSTLRHAFDRKGGIIGVIGQKGNLRGAIYLMLSQMWYSDEWHLAELFSFVRPEYRKEGYTHRLIEFAQKCSDDANMALLIGIISNKQTEAKVRLYSRFFGNPSGAFFVRNGSFRGDQSRLEFRRADRSRGSTQRVRGNGHAAARQ